ALKNFENSRLSMPSIQKFDELRNQARYARDQIKQSATHYVDCYRVER
ncbi:unnamed protein product, partial [Didymodactylos carnosus]